MRLHILLYTANYFFFKNCIIWYESIFIVHCYRHLYLWTLMQIIPEFARCSFIHSFFPPLLHLLYTKQFNSNQSLTKSVKIIAIEGKDPKKNNRLDWLYLRTCIKYVSRTTTANEFANKCMHICKWQTRGLSVFTYGECR